ncbi:MAG: serine transporter, partial [Endozoicomonas sp.]
YLVPQWNSSAFSQTVEFKGFFLALFITTPLLVFSFNHSPACSAFARSYRLQLGGSEICQQKTGQILKRNTLLLLVVILLFVFSSVLSLTPAELAQAREDNLPVLSVLASRSGNPVFAVVAPAIAFLAIASSFFGVYLGALEGLQGLFTLYWLKRNKGGHLNNHAVKRGTVLFVLLTCWGAAYADWSVIGMVEMLVVPVLATILYLMPVYALYRVERLKPCRNRILDIFTALVGLVAISGFLVSKINGM